MHKYFYDSNFSKTLYHAGGAASMTATVSAAGAAGALTTEFGLQAQIQTQRQNALQLAGVLARELETAKLNQESEATIADLEQQIQNQRDIAAQLDAQHKHSIALVDQKSAVQRDQALQKATHAQEEHDAKLPAGLHLYHAIGNHSKVSPRRDRPNGVSVLYEDRVD